MSRLRLVGLLLRLAFRRLDTLLPPRAAPVWLRLLMSPLLLIPARRGSRGERLARALEAEGPVFIKFGQFLSTRPDLLPPDIVLPLARLRDDCQPLAQDRARRAIAAELGADPGQVFDHFEQQPLAAASLAQVHAVELDGQQMVVKVLRPGIERRVERDLQLLVAAAQFAHGYLGAHLRLPEVAESYAQVLRDECDLRLETAKTSRMAKNAEKHGLLYIPQVHWPLVTRRLLVMERIYATPVTDIEALRAAGVDMKELAERGVQIFFTQLFEDNFFHGDMHPGNIMVSTQNPSEPTYVAVDCAIAGELDELELLTLGRIFNALLARDFRRLAECMLAAGWVEASTRPADLDLALRVACEPVLEQPLQQIRFGELLGYLFETARRYGLIAQPSLALLAKTLINIEGMGRQLYPELDIWGIARDMLTEWSKRRLSPLAVAARVRRRWEQLLPRLERLPELLLLALERLEHEEGSGSSEAK